VEITLLTAYQPDGRPGRIAFVSDAVLPFNKGGKERRLWEITRRLAAAGFEVHIYTMKWWSGGKSMTLDGVHLNAIAKHRPLYRRRRRSMGQAILFGLATFKLLFARFDVLDVDHMPYYPLFAARVVCTLRRKRMVATWHEVWGTATWRRYLGCLAPFGVVIEWLASRMPNEIVSVSAHTTERLTTILKVAVPVHTIGLGVDLETIDREPIASARSDIVYAGRLLQNKNIDVLIQAVALLIQRRPSVLCRIVGEGPERCRLEKLCEELNLTDTVVFENFVPEPRIYGVLKSATVFALPSVREGFGGVLLEANVCGLPAVTVDHPDNAARHLVVEGANGFLAAVGATDLSRALDVALTKAAAMDARAALQRTGYLRDWSEISAAVSAVLTANGQFRIQPVVVPALAGEEIVRPRRDPSATD